MKILTRKQILNGSFVYPSELVKIRMTKHCIERLEQRGVGLECIPSLIRVTRDNIHSGKTENGVDLSSVVVRLDYTSSKFIFLALNPKDGGVKTLWFRDKNKKGTP